MSALQTVFTDIANAIRSKTGKTGKIAPANMANEIASISGGSSSAFSWADVKIYAGEMPSSTTFKPTRTLTGDGILASLEIGANCRMAGFPAYDTSNSDSSKDVYVLATTKKLTLNQTYTIKDV